MTDTASAATPTRWKGYARDVYFEDTAVLDPETSPPAHVTARVYLDGDSLTLSGTGWSVTGGRKDVTTVTVEAYAKDVAVDQDAGTVRLAGHSLLVPEDGVPDLDGLDEWDTVTVRFFAATVTIGGPRP